MSEQSIEAGTPNDDSSTDAAAAAAVGLETLGELLAADEPEDKSGDKDAESGGSQEKTTPKKFNDLAGAVDMELDALYKLELGVEGVDEPVTIEALKDHFKSAHEFDLKVLEFEENRTQQTNELVRAKAELQEILSALPADAVKPEVLQRIRDKAEQTSAEERQKTLEVIPEWRDEDARTADVTAMAEHLQGYGFPVNYLQQVVSHQQLRYIRDNMLREQRMRAALAKVRSAKPDKSGNAPPQKKAASKGQTTIKPKAGQSNLEAIFSNID